MWAALFYGGRGAEDVVVARAPVRDSSCGFIGLGASDLEPNLSTQNGEGRVELEARRACLPSIAGVRQSGLSCANLSVGACGPTSSVDIAAALDAEEARR
jgi:hypothetical protein